MLVSLDSGLSFHQDILFAFLLNKKTANAEVTHIKNTGVLRTSFFQSHLKRVISEESYINGNKECLITNI